MWCICSWAKGEGWDRGRDERGDLFVVFVYVNSLMTEAIKVGIRIRSEQGKVFSNVCAKPFFWLGGAIG